MRSPVSFAVNGRGVTADVDGAATLLDVIRNNLGLTGTKEGCNEGECGACTVLIDGKPVHSCIYPAISVEGHSVVTVEGMSATGTGRAVQEAFWDSGGIQCGFCTPGFIVTVTALLEENPAPSEDEVRLALAGNICRCTGYSQILDAVAGVVSGKERA